MVSRYSSDGKHCFGDSVTLADICLVPQMLNARRFDCDLSPYPMLTDIDAGLEQLKVFADAHPSKQPDAE
jgi:glutathione S-transferase